MKYPLDLREQDERMYARGWNAAIEAAAKVILNTGRGPRGTVTTAELADEVRTLASAPHSTTEGKP